jgi:hypothetical protein
MSLLEILRIPIAVGAGSRMPVAEDARLLAMELFARGIA